MFGLSTIERWYYKALRSKEGPVEVLKRKIRSDHGKHLALTPSLAKLLLGQYRQQFLLPGNRLLVRLQNPDLDGADGAIL